VVGGEGRLIHFQAPLTPWLSFKLQGPAGINNRVRQSSVALRCLPRSHPGRREGRECRRAGGQPRATKGFLCWRGTFSCPVSLGQHGDPAREMSDGPVLRLCSTALHRDFGGEREMRAGGWLLCSISRGHGGTDLPACGFSFLAIPWSSLRG